MIAASNARTGQFVESANLEQAIKANLAIFGNGLS